MRRATSAEFVLDYRRVLAGQPAGGLACNCCGGGNKTLTPAGYDMFFTPLDIDGAFVIAPQSFEDHRGVFRRHFCATEFTAAGLDGRVVQGNISENRRKGTLRGFHYLDAACGEAKTLSCLRGSIYDVVVDLRPSSPTYREWRAVEMSDRNRLGIHVPPGCANAFLTLEDDVIVHYYHSCAYVPAAEHGVRYNDPIFNVTWPFEPVVISEKDRNFPDFASRID